MTSEINNDDDDDDDDDDDHFWRHLEKFNNLVFRSRKQNDVVCT